LPLHWRQLYVRRGILSLSQHAFDAVLAAIEIRQFMDFAKNA